MALMFPRVANNFAKAGYFPTDEKTLESILSFLRIEEQQVKGSISLLDPCCGEGVALAEITHHLRFESEQRCDVVSYGVEIDLDRYTHARQKMLDHCIKSDIKDCTIQPRSFSLLFLNPPYGKSAFCSDDPTEDRLEKAFYKTAFRALAYDGVLCLILPISSFDMQMTKWLSSHYENLQVYRACTDQYNQVVVFGVRQPSKNNETQQKKLLALKEKPEEIPAISKMTRNYYVVPTLPSVKQFRTDKMSLISVYDAIYSNPTIQLDDWRVLLHKFSTSNFGVTSRPLQPVGNWHRCLMLAAGVVNGWLKSDSLQVLVKGSIQRQETQTSEELETPDGISRGIRHKRRVDHQAVVHGINMTEGHSDYGKVFRIN